MDNEAKIQQLEQEIQELKTLLENHTHTGLDSSSKIKTTIEIDENEYFKSGSIALQGLRAQQAGILEGAIVVGDDLNVLDGSENSQISIQHNTISDLTFGFGLRAPIYTGTSGSVTSGGSTMTQSNYAWEDDELIGAIVLVVDGNGDFDAFEITDNNANSVTIGGTWSFSQSSATYIIYKTIYWGSAEYPWQRVYVNEGTAGGLRFGLGMTNAGQQDNGLLYMDSAGDLYWRNKAGASTKLN